METKPFNLQSPENIAKEYGGNKRQIAQAAQMGLVDPTAAVLAGMFIDRMRGAQAAEQVPDQTVAQQVFSPAMQPQQPQMMPQGMPQGMGAPGMQAGQPGAGLEALPVPNDMFGAPGMAGGGLVAFSKAGSVNSKEVDEQKARDEMRRRLFRGTSNIQSDAERRNREMFLNTGATLSTLGIDPQEVDQGLGLPTDIIAPETPAPQAEQTTTQTTAPGGKDGAGKGKDGAGKGKEEVAEAPAESPLEQYSRMLLESVQGGKQSREDAKNMALLQAGLGIMGGTSPYAAENIAKGALPATQAYQQQVQQLKQDERKTIGELAGIEMKSKELGLTEKRYKDLFTIAGMQIAAAGASDSIKLRSDIVRLATEAMKQAAASMTPLSMQDAIQQATMALTGEAPAGGGASTRNIPFSALAKP